MTVLLIALAFAFAWSIGSHHDAVVIVHGWVTGPPTAFLPALLAALAVRAVAGADSLAR